MNNYSFMRGLGNIVGFLGEEIFCATFPECEWGDGIQYDFKYRGYTFDVKTKGTTSEPQERWEASIADTPPARRQDVDFYVFVRVFKNDLEDEHEKYPKGWICGWYAKEHYYKTASVKKKGELDPNNGYVCKNDCLNLFYTELAPPTTISKLKHKY